MNEESTKKLLLSERVRASVEGMKPDEYLAKKIDHKASKKFLIDKLYQSSRISDTNKEPQNEKPKSEELGDKKVFDAAKLIDEMRAKEANKVGVKAQVQKILRILPDTVERNPVVRRVVSTVDSVTTKLAHEMRKKLESKNNRERPNSSPISPSSTPNKSKKNSKGSSLG